jgi:hypothetical protein
VGAPPLRCDWPCRNEEEGADEDDSGPDGPQFSFWGAATALTATVKAQTAKVLSTVQDVDWREELEAFQLVRSLSQHCSVPFTHETAVCRV